MKVKKLQKDAVLPKRAHDTDAGYDLVTVNDGDIEVAKAIEDNFYGRWWKLMYIEYKTGLAIEPPEGYHIEIVARSSISKTDLILANCTAIGDQGYRGEYKLRFKIPCFSHLRVKAENKEDAKKEFEKRIGKEIIKYKAGDRIAQILIRKTEVLKVQEVKELSETKRGKGGFGSTNVREQLNVVANDPNLLLGGGGIAYKE